MAETIQPAAPATPKRNTGDWRGLPSFLGVLAILGIIAVPIGVLAVAGQTGMGAGPGVTAIFSGWFSCLGLWVVAAILAALRGILSTQREVWRNTGITAQHHMHQ